MKQRTNSIVVVISLIFFQFNSPIFASVKKGILIDNRDGKKYKTVKIGNQIWMAQNLNYKTEDSYCYKDRVSNCAKYGRLYTWDAAIDACPDGWHLPEHDEWMTLFDFIGNNPGQKLKSDTYGFSAIPAGNRNCCDGRYHAEGEYAYFWSYSDDNDRALYIYLNYEDYAFRSHEDKNYGFSVRCIKHIKFSEVKKGFMTDSRDGKEYKTVKIGNLTWMAENLNYKIKNSYCYDDSEVNCFSYGRLYPKEALDNICPNGWRLPKSEDFETLFTNVGGSDDAGKNLKATSDWEKNGRGKDTYDFSVLPAGRRYGDKDYNGKGSFSSFWYSRENECLLIGSGRLSCSSEYGLVYLDNSDRASLGDSRSIAASIRCVKK